MKNTDYQKAFIDGYTEVREYKMKPVLWLYER